MESRIVLHQVAASPCTVTFSAEEEIFRVTFRLRHRGANVDVLRVGSEAAKVTSGDKDSGEHWGS